MGLRRQRRHVGPLDVRLAKREPREWAELVRKLQEFAGSDIHRELVAYLTYLRDTETEWLVKPVIEDITHPTNDKLRGTVALRYAYNRAIMSVDGLTKYAKSRAKADSEESE